MLEIFIPINITYETAIDFSKKLKRIELSKYKKIIIDVRNFMKNNGRIEPFASLIILNSLRTLLRLAKKYKIEDSIIFLSENKIKNTYAKSLRFYSCLGIPYGQNPNEDYKGSSNMNFIPIIKMDASEVFKSTDEYKEIKRISRQISTVVSRGNKELFICLEYCITEIIRNVLEHSNSKTLWYTAQYWPTQFGGQLVEIGIMDEGIGIHNSLQNEVNDEENILKFALIPGCSSKPTTHYIDENANHSGFGLYMISEIGKRNGDFIITSNNESLFISRQDIQQVECLITGTLLRLRIHINSIKNFETQKEELIKEGLEITKKYLKYREFKKFAPGLPTPKLF